MRFLFLWSVIQDKLIFEDLFCLSTNDYSLHRTITVCTLLIDAVMRNISENLNRQEVQ